MASSPMAPGHRIRPLVRPCGGNGSPPSPPPGTCPWSNGRSSTGKLRVGVKWKKKRKRKTKTKQGQSPQVVDTYPATAANRTLKSHSLGGSCLQPPRTSRSMLPQTSYSHGVSWGLWVAKTLTAQLLLLRAPTAQPRSLQQPGESLDRGDGCCSKPLASG